MPTATAAPAVASAIGGTWVARVRDVKKILLVVALLGLVGLAAKQLSSS